nr:receptor-like protein kinase FERONIA [Ipomoea batatas]
MQGFALRLSFLIIFIFYFLALRLAAGTTAAPRPYNATDLLLLNWGAASKITSDEGRDWDTDNHYMQFMPTNTAAISFQATAEQGPSVPRVPFTTARVFTSQLTYSFRVSPGHKFLRLYFYPAQYSAAGAGGGYNQADFLFSVTANHYVLLKNFSAFVTASASPSNDPTVKKEFIVDVDDKRQLNLTFSPSPNAYAFVNGIEIVSIPSDLYFRGDNYPIKLVGQASESYFSIDNSTTSLETLYRLNVGGNHLGPTDDTGMFREWSDDKDYVVYRENQTPNLAVPVYYSTETPAYTAPNVVYTSARTMDDHNNNSNGLFWDFPVDAGFTYLFRFYFCEFQREVNNTNQRVFSIEVNNSTAEEQFDVIEQSGDTEVPIMRDYVILVPDPDTHRSKQMVSLSLRPNMEGKPMYRNTILNGLEIFKLNDSTGSLAVPNPLQIPATQPGLLPEKKGRKGLRCGLPPPCTPERPSFPLLAKGGGDSKAANNLDEDDGGAFTTSEDPAKMFRTKSSVTATSTSDDSLRGQSHTIFSELSNQLGR